MKLPTATTILAASLSLLATTLATPAEVSYDSPEAIKYALLGGDPTSSTDASVTLNPAALKRTRGTRLPARQEEDCRITIYRNNDCSGVGTIQYVFPITKKNHECFDTRDHHSLWYSAGCAKERKGHIFLYSGTGCSFFSDITGVATLEADLPGCISVDLRGKNWQSAFWQWGWEYSNGGETGQSGQP